MNRNEADLHHDATIRKVLKCRTKDLHLIDDLCQEVQLRCWKYEREHGVVPQEGFAVTVALHLYYSLARRRKPRELWQWDDNGSRKEDPALTTERTDQSMVLLSLLDALPSLYREITRLHIVEGWTQQRIARDRGLPVNTVKTQFRRAKVLLEAAVKRHFLN